MNICGAIWLNDDNQEGVAGKNKCDFLKTSYFLNSGNPELTP